MHLVIDGELVETTPEHPFCTIAGEWVEAENLAIGDLIYVSVATTPRWACSKANTRTAKIIDLLQAS